MEIRIDNPELATGSAATSITALVGIAGTGDGLDDLALAASMSCLSTLDAFSRCHCALWGWGCWGRFWVGLAGFGKDS